VTRVNEGGEEVKLRVDIMEENDPTRIRKVEDILAGLKK